MLAETASLLNAIHTLGAALGVGGITFAEIFYTRAIADGRVTSCEKDYLRATFWGLRWGMTTVLLTSFTLIIVEYFLPTAPQSVMFASFWMMNTLILVIITAGWLLSHRAIPWWLGSAVAFTAWWTMLFLDVWRSPNLSYGDLFFSYVIATFLIAGLFFYIRSVATKPVTLETTIA